MESNRSGLFVYYRWLVLLLAAGLCLLPLWAIISITLSFLFFSFL